MKTLVLYYSKTGFTQRYAEWIAEETDADCEPFDHRDGVRFGDYDAVLFGSSVHAGSIRKLKWFKKQLPDWEGKRLGVFAVGAMPNGGETAKQMFAQNLTDAERSRIATFYLPGGLNYERMGALDRAMMSAFRKMLASKKDRTPEDDMALSAISKSYDVSDRAAIAPIIRWIGGRD